MNTAPLKNLRKQFGDSFVKTLLKSATLMNDVDQLAQAGVKIRRISKRYAFYCRHATKTIYIGRAAIAVQLVSLGHEKTHLLEGVAPWESYVVTGTRRAKFIAASLDDESRAVLHQLKIVGELKANGVMLDETNEFWYRRYKRGGRKAIRKALTKTPNSHSGKPYREHYGEMFDHLEVLSAKVAKGILRPSK